MPLRRTPYPVTNNCARACFLKSALLNIPRDTKKVSCWNLSETKRVAVKGSAPYIECGAAVSMLQNNLICQWQTPVMGFCINGGNPTVWMGKGTRQSFHLVMWRCWRVNKTSQYHYYYMDLYSQHVAINWWQIISDNQQMRCDTHQLTITIF